jgi:hypothetical protein
MSWGWPLNGSVQTAFQAEVCWFSCSYRGQTIFEGRRELLWLISPCCAMLWCSHTIMWYLAATRKVADHWYVNASFTFMGESRVLRGMKTLNVMLSRICKPLKLWGVVFPWADEHKWNGCYSTSTALWFFFLHLQVPWRPREKSMCWPRSWLALWKSATWCW